MIHHVIASRLRRSNPSLNCFLDCFAALAMTDGYIPNDLRTSAIFASAAASAAANSSREATLL